MKLTEFLYTTACKSSLARLIINRIFLAIIPTSVRIKNTTIILNPKDPVISGALALGVYEKSEIALIQKICGPDQIFIDVGANVGLYTAIAGNKVGPNGRVIAFEPEPESFHFLEKTVAINQLANTHLVQAAASSTNSRTKLFTSSINRGDHRLYFNCNADNQCDINTLRVDDYLNALGIFTVDIIKIDVQGYEAHVIEGMKKTIINSPKLTILMEFWPAGISAAGSNPLELLEQLENFGLTLYEIKSHNKFLRIKNKNSLVDRLRDRKYVNLALLAPQTEWLS